MERFPFEGPAEIIAHRGYSGRAPENTLAAIRAALDAGADAVEFDLHTTADGVPVLLHDETLDRTTDRSGPVAEVELAGLAGADAGSWFSADFAGEPVPPLADALALLADESVAIYPEVKRTGRKEDLHAVVEATRAAGVEARTIYISIDWEALDEIRRFDPSARIGYVVERPGRADEALERAWAGSTSALEFHMYDRRMDIATLSATTGIWRWRIRRHFKPDVFKGLSDGLLARYAFAMGVSPEQLRTLPENADV